MAHKPRHRWTCNEIHGLAQEPNDTLAKAAAAGCPFAAKQLADSKTTERLVPASEPSVQAEMASSGVARCPFGYDQLKGPAIGPMSCVICKAMLFDAVRIKACQHIYCRACIEPANLCPICAVDIDSLEPDADMNNLVDEFVAGHARAVRLASDSAASTSQKAEWPQTQMARVSVLMQDAMKAYSGRNLPAALQRLSLCKDDLTMILREQPSSDVVERLGAVIGTMGDVCRLMNDLDSARKLYEESIHIVRELNREEREVSQVQCVTINKLGDLEYGADNLEGARRWYLEALEIRSAQHAKWRDAMSAVDLAVSLAKVADIEASAGHEADARPRFEEALGVVESIPEADTDSQLQRVAHARKAQVVQFIKDRLRNSTT
eukprot:jgi/Chlat1/8986/Chrsp94S08276